MKAPLTTSRKKARLLNALNQAGDLTNAPQVTAYTVISDLAKDIGTQQQSIERLVSETASTLQQSATTMTQVLNQISQLANQVSQQAQALEVAVNNQTKVFNQMSSDSGKAFSAYDKSLAKVVDKLSTSDSKPTFLRVIYDDEGELIGVEAE